MIFSHCRFSKNDLWKTFLKETSTKSTFDRSFYEKKILDFLPFPKTSLSQKRYCWKSVLFLNQGPSTPFCEFFMNSLLLSLLIHFDQKLIEWNHEVPWQFSQIKVRNIAIDTFLSTSNNFPTREFQSIIFS